MFISDEDHFDNNPVITKLSLDEPPRIGNTCNLTVDFLSKKSIKLEGELFGFIVGFQ